METLAAIAVRRSSEQQRTTSWVEAAASERDNSMVFEGKQLVLRPPREVLFWGLQKDFAVLCTEAPTML
jgi:hypothetical protein